MLLEAQGNCTPSPLLHACATLEQQWPLERKPTLLSAPEQTLYRRLVEALPDHRVLSQVQLLQTVRFKRGSRDAQHHAPGVCGELISRESKDHATGFTVQVTLLAGPRRSPTPAAAAIGRGPKSLGAGMMTYVL